MVDTKLYLTPEDNLVLNQLRNHGDAWIVGGWVRDTLLMGKSNNDLDIATTLLPSQVMEIFPRTIPVGEEYGTVIVRLDGDSDKEWEVTTLRKDGSYGDGRRPDKVSFSTNINDDLARRDFTINAMAIGREDELIDMFGGEKDLQQNIIRAVGDANERIAEDGLRILRAFRYLDLEKNKLRVLDYELESAIRKNVHMLEKVSKELKCTFEKADVTQNEELKKAGACFGQSGEYERPMWFALDGSKPQYNYSFNYQNWYPSVEFECKNTIKNVGLFELSPFSKYEIKGEKAYEELQRLCTANIKNEIGKCTYTQMLNEGAGIETDLTVVCIDINHFRIISSAAVRTHDKAHILKHLSGDVEFKDVTDELICLGIFGPKSRSLLSKITNENLSNETFKFGTSKNINLGSTNVWVQRLSYVGELGYELYIKKENAKEIYELIVNTGKDFGIAHCGAHAMDIMRMESGFLHWGHDISPEENQYQAGLAFTISNKKDVDFIGKKALEKIKKNKIKSRFAMFTLKESEPGKPLLLHDEPIYIDDKIIGRSTSGNYSFNFKKNLVFGYIQNDLSNEELQSKNLFVEVEKQKYPIFVQIQPLKRTDFKNL